MNNFTFVTDNEGAEYCKKIADKMIDLFNIDKAEAVGRMNKVWASQVIAGEDDPIYHEDEEYWAKTIYFGKDSLWWMSPKNLNPLPYP